MISIWSIWWLPPEHCWAGAGTPRPFLSECRHRSQVRQGCWCWVLPGLILGMCNVKLLWLLWCIRWLLPVIHYSIIYHPIFVIQYQYHISIRHYHHHYIIIYFIHYYHVQKMLPLILLQIWQTCRAHWAAAIKWHSGQRWALATWNFRADYVPCTWPLARWDTVGERMKILGHWWECNMCFFTCDKRCKLRYKMINV